MFPCLCLCPQPLTLRSSPAPALEASPSGFDAHTVWSWWKDTGMSNSGTKEPSPQPGTAQSPPEPQRRGRGRPRKQQQVGLLQIKACFNWNKSHCWLYIARYFIMNSNSVVSWLQRVTDSNKLFQWPNLFSLGTCWTSNSKAAQRTAQREQEQGSPSCTEGATSWSSRVSKTLVKVIVRVLTHTVVFSCSIPIEFDLATPSLSPEWELHC